MTTDYNDPLYLKKQDDRIHAGIQKALSLLDAQQAKTLQELKNRMDVSSAPCVEQYKPMYSDGYATGYAYFSLTKNWLHNWNSTVEPSAENAFIAGWHEGQIHARSEWEAKEEEEDEASPSPSAHSNKEAGECFYKHIVSGDLSRSVCGWICVLRDNAGVDSQLYHYFGRRRSAIPFVNKGRNSLARRIRPRLEQWSERRLLARW
jgi:hypothetical protein